MEAIRVLYLESSSGRGGSSASLYRLIKVLSVNGVAPIVAVRQDGPNIERIRTLGVKTVFIPRYEGKARRLLAETLFLLRLCRGERIKLVHLNTGVASGLAAFFAARLLGIPCVSHARGNETMFMGRLSRWASRWVDAYLCVSNAVREVYGLDRLKGKEAVKTTYDGLDLEAFHVDPSARATQRNTLGLGEKDCAVGMFARFVEGKGHDQFLLAAQRVLECAGNISFFLVGANGSPYENRIRVLAETLSRNGRVQILPWQADVKPMLSAMDMVVLPSLTEGLGLALVEAMALGIPVVATKVGGIPELVRDGKEGILVLPSDPEALAQAIQTLAEDPDRRRKMSEAARERVARDFTIERVSGEVLETYERLLTQNQHSLRARSVRRLKCMAKEGVSEAVWQGSRTFSFLKGRQKKFAILMYHRVVKKPNPYFPGIQEESLKRHLAFLRRHFAVMPLREIVRTLSRGESLPPRTVALTFDDGERSAFSVAFPLLSKMKVPATVFLTTGPIDTRSLMWLDLVALFVWRQVEKTLVLSGNGIERKFSTATEWEKLRTIHFLRRWLKAVPDTEREAILERIGPSEGLLVSQETELMMTWEEARIMSEAGIEFGAHTVSHPILSQVSDEVLKREIEESKRRIEEKLGQGVSLFAYPNGEKGDFDGRSIECLKANGFEAACSTIYGVNEGLKDPFILKRVPGFEEPMERLACRLVGYW